MISTAQAEAFLLGHLGAGVHDLAPIGKGDWSQAFSFVLGGDALVARFGAHIEDFRKDQLASQYSCPNLPVPKVRDIGEALGGYFCVSDRAFGEMLESLSETGMHSIVPAVFRVFDALRSADISSSTGYGLWDASGSAPHSSWPEYLLEVDSETERVHGWHANMAESPIGAASYNEAIEFLKRHIDFCPNIRHLLHCDLLHYNVLVSGDQINAVIDWGNSLYGDYIYELAAFTFYAPWYPAMAKVNWRTEARRHYEEWGCDLTQFEERLRCYEAHIGLCSMAYSAFTKSWGDLEDNARRTLEVVRRDADS